MADKIVLWRQRQTKCTQGNKMDNDTHIETRNKNKVMEVITILVLLAALGLDLELAG